MSDCGCAIEARDRQERKTLLVVLAINAVMFAVELVIGLLADSTALIADSLDMLADALVYSISLYAVGRSDSHKRTAASFSGILQIALALIVLADVVRRLFHGSEPVSFLIVGIGTLALIANSICLSLILRHRRGGVHMRASVIFSTNDVIANIGVILAGVLVWALESPYPDLLIGLIISAIVLRGGIKILGEASLSQTETNQ